MNKTTLWKTIVILLLSANLGLTAWIFFSKRRHHEGPPEGMGNPRERLIKDLSLNKEQTESYQRLADVHFRKMDSLHRERESCLRSILQMSKSEQTDSSRLSGLIEQSADIERQLDANIYEHFKQIYNLCDQKQRAGFDKVLEGAIRRPGGNPPNEKERPPHK